MANIEQQTSTQAKEVHGIFDQAMNNNQHAKQKGLKAATSQFFESAFDKAILLNSKLLKQLYI